MPIGIGSETGEVVIIPDIITQAIHNQEFASSDWVLSAGIRSITITHALESENVTVTVYDSGDNIVFLDRVEIVSTTQIKLYVTKECPFAGRVVIIK